MNYERPYYEDINYHPLMFYIVFGLFGINDENPGQTGKQLKLGKIPKGLNIHALNREEHSEYMNSIMGGDLGEMLKVEQPELYEKILKEHLWMGLEGEIEQDDNLKYLQSTIEIIQTLIAEGAIAVLDMQTFKLYSAEEFTEEFTKEYNVYSHVTNLITKENGTIWLHTRGLRKFGRPDISIENIPESEEDKAVRIANQMIYYSSLGMIFGKNIKLHPYEFRNTAVIVHPEFIEDFENLDFNNAYYKLLWEECEEV